MAYVDTSVLAAYYCPERLSGKVQKALAEVRAPAISPLVALELYSATAQKVRRRELSAAAGRRVISQFQLHLAEGYFRQVPVGPRQYELAREWLGSFSVPLQTLDALHLATAFSNELPLVTADRALARSAKRLGIECRLIA